MEISPRIPRLIAVSSLTLLLALAPAALADGTQAKAREAALLSLVDADGATLVAALETLETNWENHLTPALLEFITLTGSPQIRLYIFELLKLKTDRDFGYDVNAWFAWTWEQKFDQPPYYADFKSKLYRIIDPRFAEYFSSSRETDIRLDEIRWGGVLQDGIPPLRQPTMIIASEAEYLDDDNVVFGLEVNGDARAYPKRILAWHEMFVDEVGGVAVAGVYCTLCGSMILYETHVDDVQHEMGTSGFLYRSNKLMYDKETQSLWNTLWGTPAVGPLVGNDIRLPRRSVVTTTWGEWRRRHPQTKVLSLDTGYQRDYGEGVAYREYFATDDLMFNTSEVDTTLANKAEVLGLISSEANVRPIAIAGDYAKSNPLLHERIGEQDFVVLTDTSGAMRAYETNGLRFSEWDGDRSLRDRDGLAWALHEDKLVSERGATLPRMPSHSAFWFGWYGAYPKTRLIH